LIHFLRLFIMSVASPPSGSPPSGPPPSRNQQKRALLERFLEEDYAFIHIKVKTPGLVLPLNVMQEQMTTLKVSFNFQRAMTLSNEGVVAELSFGNRVFSCKIPWEAIWAMTSIKDERLMWSDELPPEVLKSLSQGAAATQSSGDESAGKSASPAPARSSHPAPALAPSLVPAPVSAPAQAAAFSPTAGDSGEEPPPRKPPARPQLKRVK
jgi:stringent starvation protein B